MLSARTLRLSMQAPSLGEAHNNLAVVYMLTGRIREAEAAVEKAEAAGFRVNPQLKKDIKARKELIVPISGRPTTRARSLLAPSERCSEAFPAPSVEGGRTHHPSGRQRTRARPVFSGLDFDPLEEGTLRCETLRFASLA